MQYSNIYGFPDSKYLESDHYQLIPQLNYLSPSKDQLRPQ